MLPPGHIAAGYITAYALTSAWPHQLTATQVQLVLVLGSFIGFAPDLDMFVSFFRSRTCRILPKNNHRRYVSHIPIAWLLASSILFLLARDSFQQLIAALVLLSSWSHFLGDSLQYGIMWLYPFSKKLYSVKDVGIEFDIREDKFFSYWVAFVKLYATRFRLTFIAEAMVCVAAIVIVLR